MAKMRTAAFARIRVIRVHLRFNHLNSHILFCSKIHLSLGLLAFCLLPSAVCLPTSPLGTVFTYQGRLAVGTNPASGIYDFRFALYDAASGGTAVGSPFATNGVAVANGLFTVGLECGIGVFTGDARWLAIEVRTNGGGDFTPLTPRQSLTPAPYALYAPSAGTAATAATAGTVTGSVAASQLTGTSSSNNIGVGTITAATLAPGAVTTGALADGAVTIPKVATVTHVPLRTTFTNPTPAAYDLFGFSVAAVGIDRFLVGAYQDDTGAADTGAGYLVRGQ